MDKTGVQDQPFWLFLQAEKSIGHMEHTSNHQQPEQNLDPQADSTGASDLNQDPINVDEDVSGTTHLNDALEDSSQLENVQSELQEMKDKYLRLVAEFDNYRRRTSKERIELIQTANKEVIISMLEVLDDFERAVKQMESTEDLQAVKEGVQLISGKFKNILQAKGVRELPSLNEPFDPELHDAITEVPAPSDDLKGKVLDNVQKGYFLNDKLIRHAKVVVGK